MHMCVSTCIHVNMPHACLVPAFQSLELGLQIILKCVLATNPGPSARAASFLQRWAISPALGLNVSSHAPKRLESIQKHHPLSFQACEC